MQKRTWRTTEQHFRVFRDECRRLQRKWGVIWARPLPIKWSKLDSPEIAALTVQWDGKDKIWPRQKVILNRQWDAKPTLKRIREVARHEMAHVMLAPLGYYATEYHRASKKWRTKWRDFQEHVVLMGLIPVLFPGQQEGLSV